MEKNTEKWRQGRWSIDYVGSEEKITGNQKDRKTDKPLLFLTALSPCSCELFCLPDLCVSRILIWKCVSRCILFRLYLVWRKWCVLILCTSDPFDFDEGGSFACLVMSGVHVYTRVRRCLTVCLFVYKDTQILQYLEAQIWCRPFWKECNHYFCDAIWLMICTRRMIKWTKSLAYSEGTRKHCRIS